MRPATRSISRLAGCTRYAEAGPWPRGTYFYSMAWTCPCWICVGRVVDVRVPPGRHVPAAVRAFTRLRSVPSHTCTAYGSGRPGHLCRGRRRRTAKATHHVASRVCVPLAALWPGCQCTRPTRRLSVACRHCEECRTENREFRAIWGAPEAPTKLDFRYSFRDACYIYDAYMPLTCVSYS